VAFTFEAKNISSIATMILLTAILLTTAGKFALKLWIKPQFAAASQSCLNHLFDLLSAQHEQLNKAVRGPLFFETKFEM
jgi:hypothetical protein